MALSVGFIGVGNMGNPMAGNVLKAGFSMTVFDLNPKAMENLIQAGARKGASTQDVVDQCEVVMTCLPASPDVEAVWLLVDLQRKHSAEPSRRRVSRRRGRRGCRRRR